MVSQHDTIDKEEFDYFDIIQYTKRISNNNELCIICLHNESDEGKQWPRYKLICGHIFHTKCFNKWVNKKESINCPLCSDIKCIDKNKFCNICNLFGHPPNHINCINKFLSEYKLQKKE